MPLGMEVGLSPGDFVLDGDPAPPQKWGGAPNCRPMSIVAKRLHGSRCHLVCRYALAQPTLCQMGSGTQLPSKKGAEPPPQFSAHVCCGQTVGWIKMALGVEVGLGPGHIVLDGDPAPLH